MLKNMKLAIYALAAMAMAIPQTSNALELGNLHGLEEFDFGAEGTLEGLQDVNLDMTCLFRVNSFGLKECSPTEDCEVRRGLCVAKANI